jgi:hypothetical protein
MLAGGMDHRGYEPLPLDEDPCGAQCPLASYAIPGRCPQFPLGTGNAGNPASD